MTRRTGRRRRLGAAAGLAAVLLAATGCGDADAPAARHAGAGEQGGESRAPDQSSPGAAAVSYFEAVRDARFSNACELLAPVVRDRYAAAGQDCPTELARLFDETTRAAIGEVTADDRRVEVTGDTALVPGTALGRSDLPDGADRPTFPDVRASRQDGRWYLVL